MYYSQDVLDKFGEVNIEEILLSNKNINIYSSSYQERKTFNAIENYIIKYYRNAKTNELRDCIEDRINYLFELLEHKPYILAYSKILSNKDISRIFYQGNSYRFFKYGRAINRLEQNFLNNKDNKEVLGMQRLNLIAYILIHIDFSEESALAEFANMKASEMLSKDKIPKDDISKLFVAEYILKFIMNKYTTNEDNVRISIANLVASDDKTFRASLIGDDTIYINPDDTEEKYKSLEEMVKVICNACIIYINKKNKTNLDSNAIFDCMQELYSMANSQTFEKNYS